MGNLYANLATAVIQVKEMPASTLDKNLLAYAPTLRHRADIGTLISPLLKCETFQSAEFAFTEDEQAVRICFPDSDKAALALRSAQEKKAKIDQDMGPQRCSSCSKQLKPKEFQFHTGLCNACYDKCLEPTTLPYPTLVKEYNARPYDSRGWVSQLSAQSPWPTL